MTQPNHFAHWAGYALAPFQQGLLRGGQEAPAGTATTSGATQATTHTANSEDPPEERDPWGEPPMPPPPPPVMD